MTDSPTAGGVRARVRAELTEAIKTTARAHLASDGATSLSLRAVARELEMASSAIYRYFPSREALLTALIIDAYNTLGERVETADSALDPTDFETRWITVAHTVRDWARENPHEYALIYGSPVPGYAAPEDTIEPATRVTRVMLGLLADLAAAGLLPPDADPSTPPIPTNVAGDLHAITTIVHAELPTPVVAQGMTAWAQMFGLVSFELFGHLENVIDPDHRRDFFDHSMRAAAARIFG